MSGRPRISSDSEDLSSEDVDELDYESDSRVGKSSNAHRRKYQDEEEDDDEEVTLRSR